MGNRLTGEDRPLITSKITLAPEPAPLPGSCGLLVVGATTTLPFNSGTSAEITRRLADGETVVRAWDVLWPADGSAPQTISDTGYLW